MNLLITSAVLLVLATLAFVLASTRRSQAEERPDPLPEVAPTDGNERDLAPLGKAAVERARKDVEQFGWHWIMIPGEGAPGFLFTIGLWQSYRHPELILFAPSEDPKGMAGRLTAVAQRVAEGAVFEDGKAYDELFEKFRGAFRRVHKQWYAEYLGTAGAFYDHFDFPVLQMYWPDREGRFPWESGFNDKLFQYQSILYESNAILANVGLFAAQRAKGGSLRDSLEELFVELEPEHGEAALEDWRWLVGSEASFFRATLFGDVFLKTPDGSFHWLATGAAAYEEFAEDEAEWRHLVSGNPPTFFHVSTLLELRSMDVQLDKGQVYSFRTPLILGGQDDVNNVNFIDAMVHISNSGRVAQRVKRETLDPK